MLLVYYSISCDIDKVEIVTLKSFHIGKPNFSLLVYVVILLFYSFFIIVNEYPINYLR